MKQTRASTALISSSVQKEYTPSSKSTETFKAPRKNRKHKHRSASRASAGRKASSQGRPVPRSTHKSSTITARPSARVQDAALPARIPAFAQTAPAAKRATDTMADPLRVLPTLHSTAAELTNPAAVAATGAAKEIHNSGEWRQGSRAGAHEKSSDYAHRILHDMPLYDALRVYDHDCFEYLDRATDVKQKRARGDLGLFAAIARVKEENGEEWLTVRLEQNIAAFCVRKPERAALLEGLGKRLQRSLVVGVKVTPHVGRWATSGSKRKPDRAASLPLLPLRSDAVPESPKDGLPADPSLSSSVSLRSSADLPAVTSSTSHHELASSMAVPTAASIGMDAAAEAAAVGGSFRGAERSRKKTRPSTTANELPTDPQLVYLARKPGRPKKVGAKRSHKQQQSEMEAEAPAWPKTSVRKEHAGPAPTAHDLHDVVADNVEELDVAPTMGPSVAAHPEEHSELETLRQRIRQLEAVVAVSEARADTAEAAVQRVRRALDDIP